MTHTTTAAPSAATQPKCYCSDLQGVLCRVCREAKTDVWHTARSGRARIRLYFRVFGQGDLGVKWTRPEVGGYQVYALDGHELLPRTRNFATGDREADRAAARAYANELWGSL